MLMPLALVQVTIVLDSSNASASDDKVASVTKTAVVAAERAVQTALMEGASGKMEESVKIGYDTSSLEGKLN